MNCVKADVSRSQHGRMQLDVLYRLAVLLVLVSFSAQYPACARAEAAPGNLPEQVTLSIFATTDIHGALVPFDYGQDRRLEEGGLTRIASILEARRRNSQLSLLIDVGDTFQGNPMVHLANRSRAFVRELRHPMLLAMNYMKYDLMVPGNHDFDYGLPLLRRVEAGAHFPLVAANVIEKKTGRLYWRPYVVFRRGPLKIGVLGITSPGIPGWLPEDLWHGLSFEPSLDTARRYVPVLRNDEGCDVVVVAFHGGAVNRHSDGDPSINNGYRIARSVPGIDLLLLGHTHETIRNEEQGGVLVLQAGSHSHCLAEARFVFERRQGRYVNVRRCGMVFTASGKIPEDRRLKRLLKPFDEYVETELARRLAAVDRNVDLADAAYKDNPLMDLIQRIQMETAGADLSVCSVFDPYVKIGGGICLRNLFKLYPYENTLYRIRMSGRQIRSFLENAARAYKLENGRLGIGPEVPLFNLDVLQGLRYEVDVTGSPGSRITGLRHMDGSPLADDEFLTVAMNSYRAGGSGGYDMVRAGQVQWKSRESMRDIIAEWLRRHGSVRLSADDNWKLLVPPHTTFQPLVKP